VERICANVVQCALCDLFVRHCKTIEQVCQRGVQLSDAKDSETVDKDSETVSRFIETGRTMIMRLLYVIKLCQSY
jgi:hypothetical protein